MFKPALCAAALVVAAAIAIPAIAQQSPQADNPSANSPAPQRDLTVAVRAGGIAGAAMTRIRHADGTGKGSATAAMTTTARAGMDHVSAAVTA